MEETSAFSSHGCPSKVGKAHVLVEYVREGCSRQCLDAWDAFALDVQSPGVETRTETGSAQYRPEPRVYDQEAHHGPQYHNAPVVAEGHFDWRYGLVREPEDLSSAGLRWAFPEPVFECGVRGTP